MIGSVLNICPASLSLQIFILGLCYLCTPNLCGLLCIVKLITHGVHNFFLFSVLRRMFEEGLIVDSCLLLG